MLRKERLNIASVVYIIARYAEVCPEARDFNEINRSSGLAYVFSQVIVQSVLFSLLLK